MDVNDRIRKELATAPVVLFMKGTPDFPQCGFSAQTVAALRNLGAQFHYVNIFDDPELREALKRFSNWPTYPQLYVKGELVGGCDIALEMYRNGELKQLLLEAGAVAPFPPDSSNRARSRASRSQRLQGSTLGWATWSLQRLPRSSGSSGYRAPATASSCQPSARARCSARA